jgi:hypothetical protein
MLITWTTNYVTTLTHNTMYPTTIALTSSTGHSFLLTNVYGPTEDALKLHLLQELRLICSISDLLWVILGDINVLR